MAWNLSMAKMHATTLKLRSLILTKFLIKRANKTLSSRNSPVGFAVPLFKIWQDFKGA